MKFFQTMGVLIEEKIENDVTSTHHEMLAWHPRNDWLAIVSYNAQIGGQVHFFKHQVSLFFDDCQYVQEKSTIIHSLDSKNKTQKIRNKRTNAITNLLCLFCGLVIVAFSTVLLQFIRHFSSYNN